MNKVLFLFLGLAFVLSDNLFAQKEVVKFNKISLNDERINLEVSAILRDSKGYMWFGTDNGLIQYDGNKIKEFKNDYNDTTTINDNRVFDIREDKKGTLWFATFGGLDKYDRQTSVFSHYYLESKQSSKERPNFILQVLMDKKERLWVKRVNSGLYLLHPAKKDFERLLINKNNTKDILYSDVIYSYIDKKENIWFSLHNNKKSGLARYNYDTKQLITYANNKSANSLSEGYPRTILEDSKGNLWIGMVGSLDKLTPSTGEFTHYSLNSHDEPPLTSTVITMAEDDFGMIWAGTDRDGLFRLSPASGTVSHFKSDPKDPKSLRSNSVRVLYNDKAGTLWIGTDRGLNSYAFNHKRFNNYLYSFNSTDVPSSNYILDACVDKKDNIWYCTLNGLYKYNWTSDPELVLNIPCDEVKTDYAGRFWLGDENLLMSFNPATREKINYHIGSVRDDSTTSVWNILKDGKTMWIATGTDGLNALDAQSGKVTARYLNNPDDKNSISRNAVGPLFRNKDVLWIGPYKSGLNRINLKTGEIKRYNFDPQNDSSLSNNIVISIYADTKGRLWVGTENGLNLLLPGEEKFRRFKENDGRIFSICSDRIGNIWVSTLSGLSKIDPETFVIRDYDSNDGFQVNPAAHLIQNSKGEMILYGQNGFTMFRPEEIIDNLLAPPVSISDFQVFNKSVVPGKDSPLQFNISETKEITLPYKESFFTFEFAAHNYVSPEKNHYAYKLEGFETEWNFVGTRRFAYYTNVPPGKYTFRVKASNNDGVWNEQGAFVSIIITPPFWQTWWFRILILVVIVGVVALYFRLRMAVVRKRSAELELLVKERTGLLAKSTEQERSAREEAETAKQETEYANRELELKNKELEQFAYVASHDMQEPLRTTSSFVELLQRQYKGKLDDNADKYLRFISESSDRMRVLIKDLLDYSRIGRKKEAEQIDCNKLLEAVMADLEIAIKEAGAKIHIDPLPVINGYPTEIKQLFQNLLTNAIKFRKKDVKPEISISVRKCGCYYEFAVQDNGIGIDKKYSEKIFVIFQRLHTRAQYEGSGIGLAHCKKIVELHGGKIRIDSIPGEMTTFYFTILQK